MPDPRKGGIIPPADEDREEEIPGSEPQDSEPEGDHEDEDDMEVDTEDNTIRIQQPNSSKPQTETLSPTERQTILAAMKKAYKDSRIPARQIAKKVGTGQCHRAFNEILEYHKQKLQEFDTYLSAFEVGDTSTTRKPLEILEEYECQNPPPLSSAGNTTLR
jgi:hypothetical protein